jgi:hypothetical protein
LIFAIEFILNAMLGALLGVMAMAVLRAGSLWSDALNPDLHKKALSITHQAQAGRPGG